ncbi:MAG: DUF6316 family protein [Marinobacter sp.]
MAKFFSFLTKSNQESANQDVVEEQGMQGPTESLADESHPSPRPASSRLVETPIGWFARTREKDDLGPYPTEQDAQDALSAYLNFTKPNNKREYSPQVVYGMVIHDPETCPKDLCAFCIEAEASQEDTWKDLIED